jgi:hypothetical protein
MDETFTIILTNGRSIFTGGWETPNTLRLSIEREWARRLTDDNCGIFAQHPRFTNAEQVLTLINPDHVSAIVAPTYA